MIVSQFLQRGRFAVTNAGRSTGSSQYRDRLFQRGEGSTGRPVQSGAATARGNARSDLFRFLFCWASSLRPACPGQPRASRAAPGAGAGSGVRLPVQLRPGVILFFGTNCSPPCSARVGNSKTRCSALSSPPHLNVGVSSVHRKIRDGTAGAAYATVIAQAARP